MEFTNKFHVPLPLEDAWKLMLDVPRILPCLPGARLTDVIGDNRFRGAVQVKLGPVKLGFEGEAELVRTDDVQHIAWLRGSGLDPKGRGSAQSEFSFALQPSGSGTDVTVTTQLQLAGAVAQYGRGSGMISEVAAQILDHFEDNLAEMLMDERSGAGTSATVAQPGPMLSGTQPVQAPMAAAEPAQDVLAVLHQAQAVLAQSQAVLAATNQALAEMRKVSAACNGRNKAKKKELNGFALLWRAVWSSVFGTRNKA